MNQEAPAARGGVRGVALPLYDAAGSPHMKMQVDGGVQGEACETAEAGEQCSGLVARSVVRLSQRGILRWVTVLMGRGMTTSLRISGIFSLTCAASTPEGCRRRAVFLNATIAYA